MQLSFTEKKNIRKNFGKLKEGLSIPNLIEVQKNSYKQLTEFKQDIDQNLVKGFDRVFKVYFQQKILMIKQLLNMFLIDQKNQNLMLRNAFKEA